MPSLLVSLGLLLFSMDLSAVVPGVAGFCEKTTGQLADKSEVDPVSFFDEANVLSPPAEKQDYSTIADATSTRFDRLQSHLTELEKLHKKTRENARKPGTVPRGVYAISDLERLPPRQRNHHLGVRLSQSAEGLREVHTGLQNGARNLLEIGDVAKYWGDKSGKFNEEETSASARLSLLVERNENLLEQLHEIELKIRGNVARRVSRKNLDDIRARQRGLEEIESDLVDMKVDLGIKDSPFLVAGLQPVKPVASQRPFRSRIDEIRRDPKTPGRIIGGLVALGSLSFLGAGVVNLYSGYAAEAEATEQEDIRQKITEMDLEAFDDLSPEEKQKKIKALVDAQVFLLYKLQHDNESADRSDKYRFSVNLENSLTRLRRSLRAIEFKSPGEISAILAKHGFDRIPKVDSYDLNNDHHPLNKRDSIGDIVLSKDKSVLRDLLTKVYEFQASEYSDIRLNTSLLKIADSKLEAESRDLLAKARELPTGERSDFRLKASMLKKANSKVDLRKQNNILEGEAEDWLSKRDRMSAFNPFSVTHSKLEVSVPTFPKQEWEGEIHFDR